MIMRFHDDLSLVWEIRMSVSTKCALVVGVRSPRLSGSAGNWLGSVSHSSTPAIVTMVTSAKGMPVRTATIAAA
jgi:hypothetical protein